MKKPSIFHASNNLLSAILILSLFSTVLISSLDAFIELYAICKSQWHNFTEGLTMMQPHRTMFPN